MDNAKELALAAVHKGFSDGVELCYRVLATNSKADTSAVNRFINGVEQHLQAADAAMQAINAKANSW